MQDTAPRTDRLEFVDALRGCALFGVFWANLLLFCGINYLTDEQRAAQFPGSLDRFAFRFERLFIENKFIGLFSLLFGVSFWLFIRRARARGPGATGLFHRRIGWLFVIGAVHGWLLWAFDVLRFYALWAVLLPIFALVRPRRLLPIALAAGVVVPAVVAGLKAWLPRHQPVMDFDALALEAFTNGSYRDVLVANWAYDWYLTLDIGQIAYQVAVFGRLLLGLAVARGLDLGNLEAHRSLLRRVLLVGACVGLVGNAVYAGQLLDGAAAGAPLAFIRRFVVESGFIGLTLAYAAGLALLFQTATWKPWIRVLAPLGRMALTFYLLQTLFGVWLFYGFPRGPALMGQVGAAAIVGIVLLGFAIQIALARAWLARFRFGPAEWLWRTLTYWEIQPFRKAPSEVDRARATG